MKENEVAGIWKFLSLEYLDDDGAAIYPFGRDVDGLLMVDTRGYFSVHIMDMKRPPFKVSDPRGGKYEEIKTAFEGYIGYFGTFDIDETKGLIVFHVKGAWLPNWIGGEQLRYYQINGNRMTISTAPVLFEGKKRIAKLIWERVA
jgi:hypothetical protein